MRKIYSLALVPFAISACWSPEIDVEYTTVSDGIYKDYSPAIKSMLEGVDNNSLVNILDTAEVHPENIHQFDSDFGVRNNITGTGFIIHQDLTHYFIATNHHVVSEFLSDSSRSLFISKADQEDLEDAPGYEHKWDPNSDRATVEHSDVIFDGTDVNYSYPVEQGDINNLSTQDRDIDMAVVKVAKNFGSDDNIGLLDGYSPIELSDPIDMYDADSKKVTKKWSSYTIGYPAGYKRMNVGSIGSVEAMSYFDTTDPESYKYIQQNWYYGMFQAGGSSGSPMLNSNGELITLLASGYGTALTGGLPINEVNAAICNEARLAEVVSIAEC